MEYTLAQERLTITVGFLRLLIILILLFKCQVIFCFQATGINHISLCINAGLEPLHLSSIEEHDYFLNVYRSITTVQLPHSHIGAQKNGDDFVWKGTGERINYPVHWYQSYPKPERTNNCLLVANRPEEGGTAYFNHPCSAVYPYICQKIGG